jgi:hypothetical protein
VRRLTLGLPGHWREILFYLQAAWPQPPKHMPERQTVGSVIKKRRKRMAKKKHRKLLKKTRIQRRRQGK